MTDPVPITPSEPATQPARAPNSATTMPPLAVPETVTYVTLTPSFELTAGPPPAVPGYEILAELGRGGMGVVYKARHINLNRIVALKMILGGGHASQENLVRFLAEAEAVATLQHPNIVQIFEAGQHHGLPYFTLEYVNGGTLGAGVRDHPLPAAHAVRIVEPLARGVAYAHSKGIVHRDLKPDNVLLELHADFAEEQAALGHDPAMPPNVPIAPELRLLLAVPKITDFGLAKRVKGGSGMTHTGAIMGTPSYMAPEQAEGKKDVGPAADVYALGAILYRLVTGHPPFQAATPIDTLMQVTSNEPVPPRQLQPNLPKDLETICLKCLQKDPLKRYPSANALSEDLVRFLNEEPIRARPVGSVERAVKWARRRPTVAALAALLVLGTVAALTGLTALYLQEREDRRVANDRGVKLAEAKADIEAQRDEIRTARDATEVKSRAAVRSLEQIEVANGLRLADEGDPSGALLWFAKPLRGDHGPIQMEEIHRLRLALYARHTPRATLVQILPHAGLKVAAFSADGRWILAAGDRTAEVWDVATGRPVAASMKHDSSLEYGAFSPDGRLVVTVATGGVVRVWQAATGKPMSPPFKHPSEGGGTRAAISPEGARVVTSGEDQTARVWDTVTGRAVGPPLVHDVPLERASFSPDGKRIVTAGVDGSAHVWDAATGRVVRTMNHGPDGDSVAVSTDGRFVVTCGWDQFAHVWDAASGRKVGEPLVHNRRLGRPAISPDGRRLATVDRDGTIRVRDLRSGKTIGPALIHPPALSQMAISPDGRTLLTVGQDRTARVWDAATGRQKFAPIRFVEGPTTLAAFSPDARHILVAAKVGVMVWDLADSRPAPVPLATHAEINEPVASANARVVATVGSDNIARFWDAGSGRPAGPPQRTARKTVQLNSDGRFAAVVGPDSVLRVTTVADGQSVGPSWNAADVIGLTFAPNGQRLLTLDRDGSATVCDLATGKKLRRELNLGEPASRTLFSPDGKLAAAAGRTSIRIWDTTTDSRNIVAIACPPEIRHLEFSRDGRSLVAVGPENAVWTWNTATGQPSGPVIRHGDPAYRATFSPNGKRLLIAWKDGTARVWDVAMGQPVGPTLTVRDELITSFSPDGRLACLADGSEARLWDVATAQPAGPQFQAPGPIIAAPFAADGVSLRTLARHCTAQDWDIRPDPRPADELLMWAQLNASRRIDTFGGLVSLAPADQLAAFRELKAKSPAEFAVSPRTATLWRLGEAMACYRDGNFRGAALHLRWLAREAGGRRSKS